MNRRLAFDLAELDAKHLERIARVLACDTCVYSFAYGSPHNFACSLAWDPLRDRLRWIGLVQVVSVSEVYAAILSPTLASMAFLTKRRVLSTNAR